MEEHETRRVAVVAVPKDKALFDETATRIEVTDEGGGEFLIIAQLEGSIRVDKTEWPAIRAAVDDMMKEVR